MERFPILVTGGAGYIGSHAVLALRDDGWPVVVVDDLSTGFREQVPTEVPLIEGDVADSALVRRAIVEHRIGGVMHFAGSIVAPASVADPLGYYRNNTAASRALLEVVAEEGVAHFIFSSTAAVYGLLPEGAGPVGEEAATAPINPYGRSKLMVEQILADVSAAYPINHVALRYFNVAGADPKGRAGQSTRGATNLIKVAVEAAVGRRSEIEVFGGDYPTRDGTGVRDFIHVSDLAAAHVAALQWLIANPKKSRTLNCGYGRGYSVLEVLKAVEIAANRPLKYRIAPRRAGDPDEVVADNRAILETLDWRPRHDTLEQIVADALAWERRSESSA